jgi:hypothetical protein
MTCNRTPCFSNLQLFIVLYFLHSYLIKAVFPLVKVNVIMSTIMPATVTHLYLPWHRDINRNNPICVASPKVAKASTISVAVASIIA